MNAADADFAHKGHGAGQMGSAIGLGFALSFAGLLAAPLLTFAAVAILNALDPACGTPGNSGGCEMGLMSATVTAAIPGAIAGGLAGLAIGLHQMLGPYRQKGGA